MKGYTNVSIEDELFWFFKKRADQKVGPSAQSIINEVLTEVKRIWELAETLEKESNS